MAMEDGILLTPIWPRSSLFLSDLKKRMWTDELGAGLANLCSVVDARAWRVYLECIMNVIFDIDDVLMPWAEKVHAACIKAGLNPDSREWTQWSMWEDYGCTKEQWIEVVNTLVVPGGIYHAPPYPGVHDAVWELVERGHNVHLVTARGFFDHAEQIREWTVDWLDTFDIPGTLWFAQDKGEIAKEVGATHAIDDRYENWLALDQAGVDTYLMNQPHNRNVDVHPYNRVASVPEFVFRILKANGQVTYRD